MTCTGVVRDNRIELDGDVALPEGTRVTIIADEPAPECDSRSQLTLAEWLDQARELRSRMPMTSDSVEVLREIREERASR